MFKQYCTALVRSFYDPAIYREAILRWKGFGGLFMWLLAAVLGVMLTVSFLVTIRHVETQELPYILKQVPPVVIKNGVLYTDAKQPVVIENKDHSLKIIMDTTASEADLRATKTNIGIGKNFIFIQANGQYQRQNFQGIQGTPVKLNKEIIRLIWDKNIIVVKILAFPILWLGQFMTTIILSLIVAFLSYFVTAFMREEYDFLTRMRLAALTLAPAQIISAALRLGFDHLTAPWFILLLAILYFYVMLMLMRKLPPVTA